MIFKDFPLLFSEIFRNFATAKARSPSPNPLTFFVIMKLEKIGHIEAVLGQLAENYPSHELEYSIIKGFNGHCQVEVTTSEMRDLGLCPSFLISQLHLIADLLGGIFWVELNQETGVLTAYIS